MDQDLQGKIGRFTLPEIFQLIAASRKTGTLGIQKDDDIIMVYFKNGKIIYGYGPKQAFHLGELLKDKGKITAGQLNEAVAIQSSTSNSKRLGQILIEKNYISRYDLEQVVKGQMEELIYSLLSWDNGSFKFYENQYPTEEEITVDISVENAILEGMRRIDEQKRAEDIFPDTDVVLSLAQSPMERESEISLKSEEWRLLALINGRRTVGEIVAISPIPRLETLHRLAGLKMAGLVSTGLNKRADGDRLAEMVDNLGKLLEEYLQKKSNISRGEKTTLQNVRDVTISAINNDHPEI